MSEPIGLFSKNNDEQIRSKFKDIVTETQTETNKLITQKYNALKSLKNQMTQLKREFNRNVLSLQQNKQEKCQLLSMKIEKFCRNYETLHRNGQLNLKIEIEEYAETIQSFDGTSFQVKTTIFNYNSPVHCSPMISSNNYLVSRKPY